MNLNGFNYIHNHSSFPLTSILFLIILFNGMVGHCQENEEVVINKTTPIHKQIGKVEPRPKFFILDYELANNVKTNINSQGVINNTSLDKYRSLVVIANFPILVKDNLKVIGSANYKHKSFELSSSDELDALVESIRDTELNSVGGQLIVKYNLSTDKFLFGLITSSISSDELVFSEFGDQLNYAITLLKGKRLSPNSDIGFGAGVANTLGRILPFPILVYDHRFNSRWFLSAIAPQRVKLRYTFSKQLFAHFLLQGSAGAYQLHLPGKNKLQFIHSELKASISIERELHDWLWFKVRLGQKFPINLYVSGLGDFNKDNRIADFKPRSASFVTFTLFAVVPHRYNKAKGS